MFAGKTLINKICKIHRRKLQVMKHEELIYQLSYEELLQLSIDGSIHQRHLRYLDLEVYKSLMHLNTKFKWSYSHKNPNSV